MNPTPPPDPGFAASLLQRIRAGDAQAIEALYEREVDALYAFVFYRVGRDPAIAEDVVQETFCAALDRFDRFDPDRGSLQSWLRTLSRNVVRDALRHRKRGEELVVFWEHIDASLTAALAALDTAPLSDEVLEREETRALVHMTIANLPDRYREALEGKYLHGDSLDELAARFSLSKDATKSLLARARRAFRAAFETFTQTMAEVQS